MKTTILNLAKTQKQANARMGGTVRIPELYAALVAVLPGTTLAAFHAALVELAADDQITLQKCNDPWMEKGCEFGIRSPRGLLLYVSIR